MKKELTALLLFISVAAVAQVPQKINYQSVIRAASGAITANQPVGIRFTIHDSLATGGILYSESHKTNTNAFGLINLQIGTGAVISGSFGAITWYSKAKFLQVEADITGGNNYTTLATVELISVPYSMQAGRAADFTGTLSGDVGGTQTGTVIMPNAVTTTRIADNAVTTIKLANNAVTDIQLADNAITTSKLAVNSVTDTKIATGSVVKGINGLKDNVTLAVSGGLTLTPSGNTLTVGNTGITGVTAGPGISIGGTAGNATVSASFGGTGGFSTIARSDHNHAGAAWQNTGTVLTLVNTNTTGGALTIQSAANDFNGYGAISRLTSTTTQGVAIYGITPSTNANSAAVYGEATGAGNAKGVFGAASGANTYAVYGQASGAGAYAGVFVGNVYVSGTLSKAAGSFKIDHPLDPQNKYLSHSFVESPDMMNIYNGNITMDANGQAVVTLPDWFEALNKDFRYQLSAIGKPSPGVYISKEVSGHTFSIAGGTPGARISWMVTGIRHDPYAEKHRIPVEEQKSANERGSLLNAESYGQPRKAILSRTLPAPIQPKEK